MRIVFDINQEAVEVETSPDRMLVEVLREDLGLTSVRQTCGIGVCGTCTVLVDGDPMSSCILLAPLIAGRGLTTIEGLGNDHPLQEAFTRVHAFQCGYCTPGMILTAKRLLEEFPNPQAYDIRRYMGGNLCRCGCYLEIEQAIRLAAHAGLPADAVKEGR